MDAAFPFRTDLATGPDVGAADQTLAWLRSLERRNALEHLPSAQVLDFFAHPDERVVREASLLLSGHAHDGSWGRIRDLRTAALADADAEGVLWTPRLNAVTEAFGAPERETTDGPRARTSALVPVEAWVRACEEPNLLHRLVAAFPGTAIWGLVARHGRALLPDTVRTLILLSGRQATLTAQLLANPGLTGDGAATFARFAVDRALPDPGEHARAAAAEFLTQHQASLLPTAPALFEQAVESALASDAPAAWAHPLVCDLVVMPEAMWRRYLETRLAVIRSGPFTGHVEEAARLLRHPATPPELWRECWARAQGERIEHRLLQRLGDMAELPMPTAQRFIDEILPDCLARRDLPAALVRLHGISDDALAAVLAAGDRRWMRRDLLRNPWALQLPAAGRCLLGTTDVTVLQAIIETPAVPEWARFRAVAALLRKLPRETMRFLERSLEHFPHGVPAECFAGLLAHGDPEEKEVGLLGLASSWVRPDLPIPPAPRRGRATGRPAARSRGGSR